VSLAVIITILTVSVVASLRATRGHAGAAPVDAGAERPFRTATAEEIAALEPLWRARRTPPAPGAPPDAGTPVRATDERTR
jgi:tellurite resistance protein TerC